MLAVVRDPLAAYKPFAVHRLGARAAVVGILLAAGCQKAPPPPRLESVSPGQAASDAVTPLVIRGANFGVRVVTDFGDSSQSRIDAAYRVLLGGNPLRAVVRSSETELLAEVPAGLTPGVFDLALEDPWGRTAELPSALTIIDATLPTALRISSAPQLLEAGACSAPLVLYVEDALGAPAPVRQETTVSLVATPPDGFAFFSDAACQMPVTSAVLSTGMATATLYFTGTRVGTVSLTATALGLTPAAQEQQILAAPPARLRFANQALQVVSGDCSPELVVRVEDALGNMSPPLATVAVSLSAAPQSGFAFYTDAACSIGATMLAIQAGAESATCHFRGVAPGTVTVSAAAAGLATGSQEETVVPGSAALLVFTSPSQVLTAGGCSSVVSLETRDASGFASPVAASTTLTLAAEPPGGYAFFADPSCSGAITRAAIPQALSGTSFYMRGTAAGPVTITASADGLLPDLQRETVLAGPVATLAFISDPQAVVEGTCSGAATLETRDAFGNVASVSAGTSLSLSASPASGFAFYSDPGCTTAVTGVTLQAGENAATFYFKGSTVTTVTLTAAGAGLLAEQDAQIRSLAGARQLAIPTGSQTLSAGDCSGPVTVETQDAVGSPIAATSPVTVNLGGTPSTGFAFYTDGACANAVAAVTVDSGASSAIFHFRGTASGDVQINASASGLTGASQSNTILAGAAVRLAWSPVASPQVRDAGFAVALRALDAFNNLDPAFAAQAQLGLSPAGSLSCLSACAGATTTAAFIGGVWSGSLSVGTESAGLALTATSGAATGSSNSFDVTSAPSSDTPPSARFTLSPAVILAGQSITFDASGSSDYESPTSALEVSWDFSGAAAGAPPWTAWSATKSAANTYSSAGTYQPRLAVRDAAGNLAYARATVVVLAAGAGSSRCTVNTASAADDGASSCSGPFGTDGKLSLLEALRLSNSTAGSQTITFTSPLSLSPPVAGGARYDATDTLTLVAPSGVVLDGYAFRTYAGGLIAGVEITNVQSTTKTSSSGGGTLTVRDVYIHDAAGFRADGSPIVIERVRGENCGSTSGGCIVGDGVGSVAVIDSQIVQSPWAAIELVQCASTAIDLQSTVVAASFYGIFVDLECTGRVVVVNNTFDRNATAIRWSGSTSGHVVQNNIFSGQTVTASTCSTATFATRDYHLLFGNASNGCFGADAGTLTSDPSYLVPGAGDYRLSSTSPARDSGASVSRDLNGAAPGNYSGSAPDRGGRETW